MPDQERKGLSGDAPVEPPAFEHLSTQLSALLFDLVRTQEVPAARQWSPEVRPGGEVGRFRLQRELGRGGFGLVYEAVDGDLGRTVALKVIRPGTRIAERGREWLQREAEAVARLNHPNIVTLHDFGQAAAGPYLVFELLRGRSLGEKLRNGPLPFDDALEVAIAVARALVHAHDAGVIHRDLTPANVHLGEDGAIKVLDFGLAHLFGRDGASDGGTPAYMAPEQWEGDESDGRTDLFAFGVILHQALTGKVPYLVEKGWSEALEPGPTPELPRKAAPAAFRRIVRKCLEREPAKRPATAREVRDVLLAVRKARQGRARRLLMGGVAAVAVAAIAVAGWLMLTREPPPGEQVKVVLAGMENGAGEPALDAVPGLLAAALAPSPRVKLVPSARLVLLAREAGMGELGKMDAARGRDLARVAGAPVLLVPSSWREDGALSLTVRAIESETGRTLFSAREHLMDVRGLASAVDGLSDTIRTELRERAADRRLRRPVADAVTGVPEAARAYYSGIDCLEHRQAAPGASLRCIPFFERALALDPSFPLAQYQLAVAQSSHGTFEGDYRRYLDAALGALDRLPSREASLVQALDLYVRGKHADAARLYDAILAGSPEDREALMGAAQTQIAARDWASALKYLEKLHDIAPSEEEPLLQLVEALGRLDRRTELQSLIRSLSSGSVRREHAQALVFAHSWMGDRESAVAAGRRAVEEFGDAQLPALRQALSFAGRFGEMEVVSRKHAALHPEDEWLVTHVAVAVAGQGRMREALALVDAESALDRTSAMQRSALLSVAGWDAQEVWRRASKLLVLDPARAANLAGVLLLLGDVKSGRGLAGGLPQGSNLADQYEALLKWREGDADGAIARLIAEEVRDPWPYDGSIAPSLLIAEVASAQGDAREVLAALERFRRLPARGIWRAWAVPRALLLEARARTQMGDRIGALAALDQLDGLLARADPGFPLRRAAITLRGHL